FQERQAEKSVSLNLEQRRAGKTEDKAFRTETIATRKALEDAHAYAFTELFVAPPPPPRIKAAKTEDDPELENSDGLIDDDDADARYAKMDVYLRESLRIVHDLRVVGEETALASSK
ncbi:MAG: tail-specific protease, partial [Verrucomicrobia bacterium]